MLGGHFVRDSINQPINVSVANEVVFIMFVELTVEQMS